MSYAEQNNFARAVCGLPPSYHRDMAVIDSHRARPRFVASFDATVAGIPCGIRIDEVNIQKPLGPSADSDWDCYGFQEIHFTVLDSHGYEAPWLQKKITPADTLRIESKILDLQDEGDFREPDGSGV